VIPHAIYRGQELVGYLLALDELDALIAWVRAAGIDATREGDVLVVPDEHYDDVHELRAVALPEARGGRS
jgi:diadenosine tetraphosphate (Ap4A) HIT family hydrolase